MRRPLLGALLVLALLLVSATAQAQLTPSLDLQRFDHAANRHGFVMIEGGQQLPALRPGFDLYFGYAHHLLQRSTDDLERRAGVVDGLISGHLRVGFGFTDWAEFDLKMPFLQVARIGEAFDGLAPDSWELSLGDLAIEGRFRLLSEKKAIGIALIPFLKLPTGRKAIYTTSGVPTFGLKAGISKRWRPAHFAVHVGYELKPNVALLENFASDDEVLFGAGVGVSPVPDWLDINVEVVGAAIVGPGLGAVGASPHKAAVHIPLEVLLDARLRTPLGLDVVLGGGPGVTPAVGTPEWRVFAGVGWAPPLEGDEEEIGDTDGDGLTDDIDPCPDEAEDLDGFEDSDGCPDVDNDFDRVLDVNDDCPDVAEDRDGFEDDDGCPDPDNDGDGIADVDDLCPDRPEVFNGEKDEDGCPDDVKAVVTKEKIVILDKILFVTGKDEIIAQSFPILEAVKDLLLANPRIQRVRIEGHTDHRGDDDYNQELSETRAKAVLRYLVKAGVEGERLDSVGYGESMPIAPNDTDAGMQKNRRVEFVIVEQSP